jgi:hypothetical protein
MNSIKTIIVISFIFLVSSCNPRIKKNDDSTTHKLSVLISKKYLNLPVSNHTDRSEMSFKIDGKKELGFVIRLANDNPDYWVFFDVSPYIDKVL